MEVDRLSNEGHVKNQNITSEFISELQIVQINLLIKCQLFKTLLKVEYLINYEIQGHT